MGNSNDSGISNMAVGQNQWYHFGVGAPTILEPILVGIGMFTGGTTDDNRALLGLVHHATVVLDLHGAACPALKRVGWTG